MRTLGVRADMFAAWSSFNCSNERNHEMRTRLLALLAAFALVLAAGFAAGCGDDDDDGGGDGGGGGADLGPIKRVNCSVGTDTPYPPFEIGQPPDFSGFDIEVMDAIAEELGLEVDLPGHRRSTRSSATRPTASSTPRPRRRRSRRSASRTVDFSDPYYEADAGAAGGGGRLRHRHRSTDLGGKIVGAQDGTTGETYANDKTDAPRSAGSPRAPTRSPRWPPGRSTR